SDRNHVDAPDGGARRMFEILCRQGTTPGQSPCEDCCCCEPKWKPHACVLPDGRASHSDSDSHQPRKDVAGVSLRCRCFFDRNARAGECYVLRRVGRKLRSAAGRQATSDATVVSIHCCTCLLISRTSPLVA